MYISETSYQKDFNQITKSLIRLIMSDLITSHGWQLVDKDDDYKEFKRDTHYPGEDDNLPYTNFENISVDTTINKFTYRLLTHDVKGTVADDIIELHFANKEEMIKVMGQEFTDNFYRLLDEK